MDSKAVPAKQALAVVANVNYDKKLGTPKFRKVPRCIYFYYIGPMSQGNPVNHYYYADGDKEIEPQDLRDEVLELVENARLSLADQAPPPDGADWAYIVWTRKSYLVVLIDDPEVKFKTGNAIEVRTESGGNNSFFDAQEFKVPSADGSKDVPVVYCINHMKKNGGNDLGKKQREKIKIKLNTTPPLIRPRPDDGGTNMGPPVPPP